MNALEIREARLEEALKGRGGGSIKKFEDDLHPRDRKGQWSKKLGSAINFHGKDDSEAVLKGPKKNYGAVKNLGSGKFAAWHDDTDLGDHPTLDAAAAAVVAAHAKKFGEVPEEKIPGATAIVKGKAGRFVKLDGKQVHIPHHDDFSRKVGDHTFTSPAGTTAVYKNDAPYNAPKGVAHSKLEQFPAPQPKGGIAADPSKKAKSAAKASGKSPLSSVVAKSNAEHAPPGGWTDADKVLASKTEAKPYYGKTPTAADGLGDEDMAFVKKAMGGHIGDAATIDDLIGAVGSTGQGPSRTKALKALKALKSKPEEQKSGSSASDPKAQQEVFKKDILARLKEKGGRLHAGSLKYETGGMAGPKHESQAWDDAAMKLRAEGKITLEKSPLGDHYVLAGSKTGEASSKQAKAAASPKGPIPNYDGVTLTGATAAGGSTGAQITEGSDGKKYLVKTYGGDQDRVATELAANAIYRALGVKVPEAGTKDNGGKPALVYPLLDGSPTKIKEPSAEIGKHFMADALVANWDFIGLTDDNILWDKDGKPFRVDQGGTLQYRAQGAKKTFGTIPGEVETMLSGGGQGVGKVKVSEEQKKEQAAQIAKTLTRKKIKEILAAAPFADEKMRSDVEDALNGRVAWMAKYAAGDKTAAQALASAASEQGKPSVPSPAGKTKPAAASDAQKSGSSDIQPADIVMHKGDFRTVVSMTDTHVKLDDGSSVPKIEVSKPDRRPTTVTDGPAKADPSDLTKALTAELAKASGQAKGGAPAAPTFQMGDSKTNSPARSPSGNLRNFGAMGDVKLMQTWNDIKAFNDGADDPDGEAQEAIKAEMDKRGISTAGATAAPKPAIASPAKAADLVKPKGEQPAAISGAKTLKPELNSPGRGPTGALRNFAQMGDSKLAKALLDLVAHGGDPEALHAAQLEAIKRRPNVKLKEAMVSAHASLSLARRVSRRVELFEAADSMLKASTPEPFSKSKTSNWVAKGGGLPPYIQHVAHGLVERGKTESEAIQMAIGIIRRWARGGGNVDAGTRAAAAKALAEWNALKAKNAAKGAA